MARQRNGSNPYQKLRSKGIDTMTKSRIVSSSHLVAEGAAETSELEYGLFVATNAFNR